MTRLVAEKLSGALGQTVVVDNKPGAGGVLAVKTMLAAKPDGYTLLLAFNDNYATAPFLLKNQPYDPLKDFTYISIVSRGRPFVVATNPALPYRSLREVLSAAKAAPDQILFASYGVGSLVHLSF